MSEHMEVLPKTEGKLEAVAVLNMFEEMTPVEQKKIMEFMKGIRSVKKLESKTDGINGENYD